MTPNTRLEKLKQIVDKRPDDSFARYGLAMELRNQGELQHALEAFAELIRKDPDYVPAYYHYGITLQQTGNPEPAAEIFRKGQEVARRKQDSHAYSELERALQELQQS